MIPPKASPTWRRLAGGLCVVLATLRLVLPATAATPGFGGTDTDGDGLPDDLEIQIGSSPTNVDTDKDGASDYVEYLAGTSPRDPKSFPIFLNLPPGLQAPPVDTNLVNSLLSRQFLTGDTIVLRPFSVTNVITYTNIVIEPIEVPPDAPPDAPTTKTNITLYPSYATYQWYRDSAALSNQNTLELVLHQARTNDSGLYRLSAVIDYITGFSTNSGVNEAGETTNNVVTNYARASQLGGAYSVQTLPATPRVRIGQPAGAVVGWGNNIFKQADIPTALTNAVVVQAVGGRAHSAALLASGAVTAWGTNDVGQLNLPAGLTNVVALASGLEHLMALKADGTVVAWGWNGYGQTNVPKGLTNVRSIAAGYFHSLAVLGNGNVVAWGANESRQSTVPANATSIVQVVGGGTHSAALTSAGRVIAWGNTNLNRVAVPANATNVVQLAAGDSHTVALLRHGGVVVWGDNSAQQGTLPATVGKALSVAAGDSYTALVTADGKLRAFGAKGVLYADSVDAVGKVPATVTNAFSVSSGFFHLLALVSPPDTDQDGLSDEFETRQGLSTTRADTDGDGLYDGNELRLGTLPRVQDSDGDRLTDLVEVREGFDPLVATEAADGSLSTDRAVQLDFFTLGRGAYQLQGSTNGTDWEAIGTAFTPTKGWGSRLVDPTPGQRFFRVTGPANTPVTALDPREVVGNHVTFGASDATSRAVPPDVSGLVQVAAGDWHTLGLRWDGTVEAWGVNVDGQTDVPAGLDQVVAIAAGGQHSLALRADGSLVAWGRNHQGQATIPAGLPAVRSVAAGSDFNVAVLADRSVTAWGGNLSGQSLVPAGLGPVRAVAAGLAHVVALREDGRVVCWGDNRFGQLAVPANLGTVIAVAAGDLHSLAVRADGTVVCWGNDSVGQCRPPAGLSGVVDVAAGFRVSVARTADGRVVAWGEGGDALTPPAWFHGATQVRAGGFAIYALKAPEDQDGDLVDDAFEAARGTDPGRADTDGDGLADGLELLYGFDPLQPDAAGEATLRVRPAVKLTYFTVSTGSYQLSTSTDLVQWTPVGPVVSGVRGFSHVLESASTDVARFYRFTPVAPVASP